MSDSVLRRLARDQWVRIHGTPRVTVLAGGAHARDVWNHWLALAGATGAPLEGDFGACLRDAVGRAALRPAQPIAVLASAEAIAAWRASPGRADRLAAMLDEGFLAVSQPETPGINIDARSAAEATLFEALEATAATAGKFALNESLSVRFGPVAAEVDLLARRERIAVEIDGIHHFADPDCYRRDRKKDLLMQGEGLIVVRLLAEDVLRDVREAVAVVCQALAHRLRGRA